MSASPVSSFSSPSNLESKRSFSEEDFEGESSTVSSADNHSDKSTKSVKTGTLPIMTLQKLRFYPKTLKPLEAEGLSKLEALALAIEQIITNYRTEHKSEIFEIEKRGQFPKNLDLYDLKIYYWRTKTVKQIYPFLKSIGASSQLLEESIKTHDYFLFFFYRIILPKSSSEVFVATTGHAWQIPRPFADHLFPIAVAKRVLDPALNKKQSKHLSGGTDTSIDYFRRADEVYESEGMNALVTQFSTVVKQDSSLQAVLSFRSSGKTSKRAIEVSIGSGSLKISRRLNLEELCTVLSHLSKIARDEPTFLKNDEKKGREEDDPKFRFLDHIQPVLGTEKEKLQELLKEELWKLAQDSTFESTLWVCHKFSIDYFKASPILFYARSGAKKAEHSWSCHPLISDILVALRDQSKTKECFFRALDTCQIAFHRGHKAQREPVINFIEGEIWTEKGILFKLQGIWRRVSSVYHELVDRDFHRLLDTVLVVKKEDKDTYSLPRPWVRKKEWTQLSQKELSSVTELKKTKATALLKNLEDQKYSFIDEKNQVTQRFLFGPILDKISKKHHDAINELLEKRESISLKDLQDTLKIKQKAAEKIYQSLKEDRPRLEKASKSYYQVQVAPDTEEEYKKLQELLSEKEKATDYEIQDEGEYNESYLKSNDYIVGDRVCPDEVELWDLLKYNQDHLIFYHVKESFGQKTRDACSQIIVAAKTIFAALKNLTEEDNILHKWWNQAINYKKSAGKNATYRGNLRNRLLEQLAPKGTAKKQLEEVAKRAFLDLFNEKKKVTFVYAFLDTANQERTLEAEYQRHLFNKAFFTGGELKLTKKDAQNTLQILTKEGYLSRDGYVTEKFLEAKSFPETLKLNKKQAIFKAMKDKIGISQFRTTLAKIELLRTASELKQLGIQLKIVQIRRPKGATGNLLGEVLYLPPSKEIDADPLDHVISNASFEVGNKSYFRRATRGWGSCAIHAFYGKWNGTEYAYRTTKKDVDLAAKQFFVEKLKTNLQLENRPKLLNVIYECLDELIERKEKSPNYGHLFSDDIREDALKTKQELSGKLSDLEKEEWTLWQQHVTDNSGIKEELKETVRNNVQKGSDLVQKRADFISALTQLHIDVFDSLSADISNLGEIQEKKQKRQDLIKAFVEKYLDRYLAVLTTKNYWYLDFELKIMAILENRTVYLFKEGMREFPHIFNESATPQDPIVIEQTGNASGSQHYNRCMPIQTSIDQDGLERKSD